MFNAPKNKPGSKVCDNIYYFGESGMLDCNQYVLVSDEGEAIVIDAGNGKSLTPFIESLPKINITLSDIKGIIITHEHVDHLIGIYKLHEMMGDEMPELFAIKQTAEIIQNQETDKIFPRSLPISPKHFGIKMTKLPCTEIPLDKPFELCGFTFEVFHTPGHSQGSGSFFERDRGVLFPGDVVFPGGSFGRYDFPGGDLKTLKNSILRLSQLKGVDYLCAGHMRYEANGEAAIKRSLKNIESPFLL